MLIQGQTGSSYRSIKISIAVFVYRQSLALIRILIHPPPACKTEYRNTVGLTVQRAVGKDSQYAMACQTS